jgi:hypothetical protein
MNGSVAVLVLLEQRRDDEEVEVPAPTSGRCLRLLLEPPADLRID